MNETQYFSILIALLPALLGSLATIWVGIGRRQRLKLAIEVQHGVAEDQRFLWDEMIRRDVTAITRASLQPVKPMPFLIFGVLLTIPTFLPSLPSAARLALQVLSLLSTITGLIALIIYWWRVRSQVTDRLQRTARSQSSREQAEAKLARLEDETAELERAMTLQLDWASRALYIAGAPMAKVREARVETAVEKLPQPALNFDRPSWRIRRMFRCFWPGRKRFDFTTYPTTAAEPIASSLTERSSAGNQHVTKADQDDDDD